MRSVLRDLVDAAAGGRPVYISSLRERFADLEPASSFELIARFGGFEGDDRVFAFRLPRYAALAADEQAMVTEYVLAGVYNILSTVGGRSLALESVGDDDAGRHLAGVIGEAFGIALDRLGRPGYGRAVNVSERMDEAIAAPGAPDAGRFTVVAGAGAGVPRAAVDRPGIPGGMAGLPGLATRDLRGTTIVGMDIGGTDIKLCLAVDGRAVRFVEYDWFPAAFTGVDQIIDPVLLLVRLMRLEASREADGSGAAVLADVLAPAYAHGADAAAIEAAVKAGEALVPDPVALDAIGVCFPDVVVRDRIVGGEVYKTRGMRAHLGAAYESEFRRLSVLDDALRAFVRRGGIVGIINDGPMAAFTAAVERGVVDPASIASGVFAHTLGTELGTGWVTEAGSIPDLPLEIYNCIIDLGSYPERAFEPDDVRSVNNFNTRLAGTLQKYTSQSGVFRLAAKYLPVDDPALFAQLFDRGLLVRDGARLLVPTEPRDMRKPLLEFLMAAAEDGGHPAVDRIFREIGEFLAVAWQESRWLLDPATDERILFGRLVKRRACFDLMVEGARRIAPTLDLVVADDEMANTDLMGQLRDHPSYTVAQFAQAIGAIHYANYRRHAATVAAPAAGAAS